MHALSRRRCLQIGSGLAGLSLSGFLPEIARAWSSASAERRHCILLWMPGGPSQLDTFDLKPGHANGGEFQEIETSVPGVRISEQLPRLAQLAEHLAIVRSLSTSEGDHSRGTFLMHTGQRPGGPISYPTIGAALSKELGHDEAELPNFVSISPYTAFNSAAFGPGFLGPRYAPLTVSAVNSFQQVQPGMAGGYAELGVDDLSHPGVDRSQEDARLGLWQMLQEGFLRSHAGEMPAAQNVVHERAVRMMRSEAAAAFDLSGEPAALRDAYGPGRFGQGCLIARRLIERGVPFIEIALSGSVQGGALGWDSHINNFTQVKSLSAELDAGWATLMTDLRDRGLLESTTILWLGEFGRTPVINQNGGRDHFPAAWSTVLAGGGIRGGQVYGRSSADGMTVEDRRCEVGDVLTTLCRAVGVDPHSQNISELGRPIRIAEGTALEEVLA